MNGNLINLHRATITLNYISGTTTSDTNAHIIKLSLFTLNLPDLIYFAKVMMLYLDFNDIRSSHILFLIMIHYLCYFLLCTLHFEFKAGPETRACSAVDIPMPVVPLQYYAVLDKLLSDMRWEMSAKLSKRLQECTSIISAQ